MATFTIAAVSAKKTGTTNGRKWTLYEVRAKDGAIYTTFDVEWQRHVSETLEAAVSERNRLGVFPKVQAHSATNGMRPQGAAVPATASPDRFAVLVEKLDRALEELAQIRRHFA